MPIVVLAIIGLVCGLVILLVYLKLPQKVIGIEKTEEISSILPGGNCGACGYPGCFAYAEALTHDPELMLKSPCSQVMQDEVSLEKLSKAIRYNIDAAAMCKKAIVHCAGNSETICDYSGNQTCKAASQLVRGYKKCPFACLGLGDCVRICPLDAIAIKPGKNTAVVTPHKCSGCGLCVTECPQKIISLEPCTAKIGFLCDYKPIKVIPGRERCEKGCIHCQKCVKACEYGAIEWNKEKAIPVFDQDKCTLCLKCVEACPQNTLADCTWTVERGKVGAMLC